MYTQTYRYVCTHTHAQVRDILACKDPASKASLTAELLAHLGLTSPSASGSAATHSGAAPHPPCPSALSASGTSPSDHHAPHAHAGRHGSESEAAQRRLSLSSEEGEGKGGSGGGDTPRSSAHHHAGSQRPPAAGSRAGGGGHAPQQQLLPPPPVRAGSPCSPSLLLGASSGLRPAGSPTTSASPTAATAAQQQQPHPHLHLHPLHRTSNSSTASSSYAGRLMAQVSARQRSAANLESTAQQQQQEQQQQQLSKHHRSASAAATVALPAEGGCARALAGQLWVHMCARVHVLLIHMLCLGVMRVRMLVLCVSVSVRKHLPPHSRMHAAAACSAGLLLSAPHA